MTPERRLELIQELKSREHRTLRRARIGAWASVVLAACITASLLYVAYRELGRVEQQVSARRAELKDINEKLAQAQTRLRAWQTVVGEIPKKDLEAGFARASASDPSVEKILARVYIQAPPGDEAKHRAEQAQRALRQAGFVVPGIEVRPETLRQTEVRYYKSGEGPQAQKIADVLRSIGEQVGPPKHLKQYENSDAVRPNHYEVWLGAAP